MQAHEYANLFPMMSAIEHQELKADIQAKGVLNPIITLAGQILDGRNRFKACEELGVKPEFLEYSGNDPLSDVISWNLKRRHLSESQRAIIAASLANIKLGDNQFTGSANLQTQVSQSTAAEMLNVSPRTVASAKKIQDEAIPEIVEKVKAGEVSINAATIASTFTEEEQAEIVEEINAGAKPSEVIKAHVAHNSGENEWYTPEVYIQSAKVVLGDIDLDPASCELANATVKAAKYYSKDDNGLDKEWGGNVWVNPPYAQPLISQFSEKVVAEKENIEQAIVLVNNATETKWFANMAKSCDAICFPQSRIKFIDKHGKPSGAPLQGQAFIYFGDHKTIFAQEFSQFGFVLSHV